MADAVITIKLTPEEYRDTRASLEARQNEALDRSRETQGTDHKLSRALSQESARLGNLLKKI